MKVLVTETAWNDLLAIAAYVALDNRQAADRLIDALHAACQGLVDTPEAYPVIGRYAHLAIRRRVAGNYVICYRVREGVIEVLHVIHGARDLDAILDGQE